MKWTREKNERNEITIICLLFLVSGLNAKKKQQQLCVHSLAVGAQQSQRNNKLYRFWWWTGVWRDWQDLFFSPHYVLIEFYLFFFFHLFLLKSTLCTFLLVCATCRYRPYTMTKTVFVLRFQRTKCHHTWCSHVHICVSVCMCALNCCRNGIFAFLRCSRTSHKWHVTKPLYSDLEMNYWNVTIEMVFCRNRIEQKFTARSISNKFCLLSWPCITWAESDV